MRSFSKCLYVLVALVMVLGAVLAACAQPAPEKPIILRFATLDSPTDAHGIANQYWAQELEKRTNGRIKVEIYWQGSLLKAMELVPGVAAGTADMCIFPTPYFTDTIPLYNVGMLPMLATDMYGTVMALYEMVETMPAMKKEFTDANLKFMIPSSSPSRAIACDSPVLTLEDLKGKKFQSAGMDWPKLLKELGATPVTMPFTEVYSAVEKGVMNGMAPGGVNSPIYGAKIYEVTPHLTIVPGALMPGIATVMGLDFWNKLPSDIQDIVDELSREMVTKWAEIYIEEDETAISEMKKAGVQVYTLPDEDVARLKEMSLPMHDEWARTWGTKGLPATEVLNKFKELHGKYKQG